MNEHDEQHDVERLVARSLQERTAALQPPAPDLDGVWSHLDRRRNRRRHVAVVGSLAAVALGAFGFATLGQASPESSPVAGPEVTATTVPGGQMAWRCTNPIVTVADASDASYFATCESVLLDGGTTVIEVSVPTTTSTDWWGSVGTTEPTRETWYTVQDGDTLESIAAAHGVSGRADRRAQPVGRTYRRDALHR